MIKVSVIVPVYNVEKYLGRCLDSLLHQTYRDYEIICVNDDSPDKSQKILEEYERHYPYKISVIINEYNMGPGKTRERGMAHASGDYVMFVDSDDYVEPEYIETYMGAMKEHPCDIIIGGYIKDVAERYIKHTAFDSEWSILTYTVTWGKLYRKAFFIENEINFLDIRWGEDIFFSLSAYYCGVKYYVMKNYCGYYYFLNKKSITGSTDYNDEPEKMVSAIFDAFMERYDLSRLDKDRQYAIEYTYIAHMVNALVTYGGGGRKRIKERYSCFADDIVKRFPDYASNPYIGIFKPRGQLFKIRMGVGITVLLQKLGMARLMFEIISIVYFIRDYTGS